MRMIVPISLLVFSIGAINSQAAGQFKNQQTTKQDLVKITSVDVRLQIGPEKTAWGKQWKDNTPQRLRFRWSSGYINIGSAVWQVSTDPTVNKIIASGDAGKPQTTGKLSSFTIDFKPIVGNNKNRPLNYYVRVVTYKAQRLAGVQPEKSLRQLSKIVKTADLSRLTRKKKSGPPSQPVHIAIIPFGPVTEFTELPESIYELDQDHDGLPDNLERMLAEQFKPFFIFDSAEKSRRSNEPVVLFQVRPEGCVGRDCKKPYRIWIRYIALFARDGGYGPSSDCHDSHKGDNVLIDMVIINKTGWDSAWVSLKWRLVSIKNWKLDWPQWSANFHPHNSNFGHKHPIIFLSAHKHHQYFDTNFNEKDSIYSDYGCNDDVDGKGAKVFSNLISPLSDKRPNNVGEPEAHNKAFFINNLSDFGYPGESAWGNKSFRGGFGGDGDDNIFKKMWLDHEFHKVTTGK